MPIYDDDFGWEYEDNYFFLQLFSRVYHDLAHSERNFALRLRKHESHTLMKTAICGKKKIEKKWCF